MSNDDPTPTPGSGASRQGQAGPPVTPGSPAPAFPAVPPAHAGAPGSPPPPPAPRDSLGRVAARSAIVTTVVLVIVGVFFGIVSLLWTVTLVGLAAGLEQESGGFPTTFVTGDETADERILAVPVTGVILGEGDASGFDLLLGGVTYGQRVADVLAAAAEDDSIEAVVLEMDTPGGTVFGSEAIATAVDDYREATGKPVVAYVGGLSASGGMWAMAGADRIVAARGTSVGSIGVVAGPIFTYDDVVATDGGLVGGGVETRGGVTSEFFSAGEGKTLGDPFRPVTDREREVFQGQVDLLYGDFVDRVSETRGIEPAVIVDEIGAHLYTAQSAVELGLADELGGRDDAYGVAAELAGLEPDAFGVDRLGVGSDPLWFLGVLGVGTAGDTAADPAGEPASAADGPAGELCAPRGAPLVYAGDLATLCGP